MNSIDCSKYIRNYLLTILFFVFFYINNIYGTQLAVEVPKGAQCFFVIYFPKDGSGDNTQFVHIIDGTVGGFFRFGMSVPVQTNLEYQILAYSGVKDPGQDPNDPSDDYCTGTCLGDAANLIPTDNDLKNELWKINTTNFGSC
ncbi:hypothetical protein F8M41_003261 [Gigaspora margarita]|uniref:Uncharacterized protein n=1 Tax=Gigaspora margarita TaxID=4874 RepID=A0A8H4A7K1_GIGMA|nr:hypothetical protein F8M41_003261 [Gigaspora margarita]